MQLQIGTIPFLFPGFALTKFGCIRASSHDYLKLAMEAVES